MPTQDSTDRFLSYIEGRGASEHTIRAYRSDLTQWVGYRTTHSMGTLADVSAAWLTSLTNDGAKPTTVRRKLGTVRSFMAWRGTPDFLSDYRAPTPARARPHPLPGGMDDVRAMLRAAGCNVDRALVALGGMLGLRVSETLAVTTFDFDEGDETLTIMGKGNRERVIPIPSSAWFWIAEAFSDADQRGGDERLVPLIDRTARSRITALGRAAGVSRRVSSHDLRATLATTVYQGSKDLRATQDILGHADPRTTLIYTDAPMDSMREAMEAV